MGDWQGELPDGCLHSDCSDLDLQQLQNTFEGLSKAEMASLDASECLGQCPFLPDQHEVPTVPFCMPLFQERKLFRFECPQALAEALIVL